MRALAFRALVAALTAHSATAAAEKADSLDLLWPSPLLKVIDPVASANNKALRRLLLSLPRTGEPGVKKTNIGGWQSDVESRRRSAKRPPPLLVLHPLTRRVLH